MMTGWNVLDDMRTKGRVAWEVNGLLYYCAASSYLNRDHFVFVIQFFSSFPAIFLFLLFL